MTIEELKSLGWNYDDSWNNREFFSQSKESKYSIFEHNGDWGILDPYNKEFALIYCNLTDEEIQDFTNKVKTIEEIISKPKDFTLYEYFVAATDMQNFVEQMRNRS